MTLGHIPFHLYLCFPRRQTQNNVNGQFLLENSIKYENIVKSWCFAAAVYSQKLFLSSKYLNWIPWFPFLQVCQFAISRSHSSSVRKRFSWSKPPPNLCGLSPITSRTNSFYAMGLKSLCLKWGIYLLKGKSFISRFSFLFCARTESS